jgi:hypothetical protein
LKLPDNDKGATGEQARERLKKKLAKSLTKWYSAKISIKKKSPKRTLQSFFTTCSRL